MTEEAMGKAGEHLYPMIVPFSINEIEMVILGNVSIRLEEHKTHTNAIMEFIPAQFGVNDVDMKWMDIPDWLSEVLSDSEIFDYVVKNEAAQIHKARTGVDLSSDLCGDSLDVTQLLEDIDETDEDLDPHVDEGHQGRTLN